MKNCCSLEFIHGVFLTKKEAIYKIAIKPCEKSDSGLFCRKEQGLTRHE